MKKITILLVILTSLTTNLVAQKIINQTLNLKIDIKKEWDEKMLSSKLIVETNCGKNNHNKFSIWIVSLDPQYDSLLNKLKVDSLPMENVVKEKIAHDASSFLGYCLESEEFISTVFTLLYFNLKDDFKFFHMLISGYNSRPLEKLKTALWNFKIQQRVKEE